MKKTNTKKRQTIDKSKTEWYPQNKWKIKENTARKIGGTGKGSHPSIEVGKNGRERANIGLTTSKKRGNHSNIELSRNPNPKDNRKSYLRDDLRYDDKKHLEKVMSGFRKLPKSDQEKVLAIIKKQQSKK